MSASSRALASALPCAQRRWRPALGLVVLTAAALGAGGCATYSSRSGAVRTDLAGGDFDGALSVLEKNRRGKDLLLYHLERGLVLHYADRWAESNQAFQQAEELAADLYTRSISEGVLSLITSDNTIAYRAESFELAMVPYYRALNYIYLGEREPALVEARKASLVLRQYVEQDLSALGEAGQRDAEMAERLKNSGFLHYFSGLLYEWGGDINDAFIAYRNAADAYHGAAGLVAPPPWLAADLRRTAQRLGFGDELLRLETLFPELFAAATSPTGPVGEPRGGPPSPDATTGAAAKGDVVVLVEVGYVPVKVQNELNLPILKSDDRRDRDRWAHDVYSRSRTDWSGDGAKIAYWLRVAVPELVSNRPLIQGARLSTGLAGSHAVAAPVEDLEGRAFATFRAKEGAVMVKTIARALAKYGMKEGAERKGQLAGLFANLLGAATETADTRSWLTLPNMILMARLQLPPGRYELRVDLVDAEGRVVETRTIPDVTTRAGGWTFVSRRAF